MRKLLQFSAFALLSLVSLATSAAISPPTIDGPLYSCATMVSVKGFIPGAKIDIYVAGTTWIGGGVSDSPWGQAFKVSPALGIGQALTATQTFGSEASAPSAALKVGLYERVRGTALSQPVVSAPLYACGGALSVTNLAKGGHLRVFSNGSPIGEVDGSGDSQWLRNSPLFYAGQQVTANQQLCSATSTPSLPVLVSPTPASLPAVAIDDIYEGSKYASLSGITNGALVTTTTGPTVLDKGFYPGGGQIIRLTPPPASLAPVTAVQELCSVISPPSVPVEVKPCSALPPPSLAPICPGDTKAGVSSVLDARVQVYADGTLVADGGGPVVNFFSGSAKWGQNYTAVQTVGACVSPPSPPLAVGCILPKPIPVGIGNGGRAVAIAVDPADAKNITVASETGGLFRSSDKGAYWTHTSRSTTFGFTDVTYVPGNPSVVVASAGQDTRTVSGGGLWRSVDGGVTWKQPPVAYATADCKNNASAFALAVGQEAGKLWAGTSCGVATSTNAGASWTYLSAATGYNNEATYALVAPSKDRLVILTGNEVRVSKDGGGNFTQSSTGLPAGASGNTHNQIAVPSDNPDHIYWAFTYWELIDAAKNDYKAHNALYRSLDFGSTWEKVLDNNGIGRPPFVRLSEALNREATVYQVYYGDGSCGLQRATVNKSGVATISSWTSLSFDHCDPSDLAFDNDRRTPLLLTSDGGLHATADSGSTWKLTGAGPQGYNALQITEATGQFHRSGANVDLYFATQDNSLWASPDGGLTWPANRCCEGFFLNIPRSFYPPEKTRLSGVSCAGCGNFISERLLGNQQGFPNPPNDKGNPRLLKPGSYIQNTSDPSAAGSTFVLTNDTGGTWNSRFFYPEEAQDLSQISGPVNDPAVYTPVLMPGTTSDNQGVFQLKRISGVLAAGSPTVSDAAGSIKSMGIFGTMFAWYKVFGVDPSDPNYLMVPDRVDAVVKVSTDGGGAWVSDNGLTNSVTQGGQFKFDIKPVFVQVTTIGVDPDCKGHILVGTQQAGIFVSYNAGGSWGRVAGSEVIPYVSRFFFKGGGEVIASSYGRGLWKLAYSCERKIKRLPRSIIKASFPLLHWKGSNIPLSAINVQPHCRNCYFLLVQGGNITGIDLNNKSEVRKVSIDGGRLRAFRQESESAVPIRTVKSNKVSGLAANPELTNVLGESGKIKGLLLDGAIMRGAIVAAQDVSADQLPRARRQISRLQIESKNFQGRVEVNTGPIEIAGRGFDRRYPLEILIDGRPFDPRQGLRWPTDNSFQLWIPPSVGLGGHTVVVRQRTEQGVVENVVIFHITPSDKEEEEKRR